MNLNKEYYGKLIWHENFVYEPEVWPYAKCPEGGGALDVGAHYGKYTLKFSHAAGEKGKVYAIEPDPHNFEVLNKNILLNKLKNVVALRVALSNYDGEGELFIHQKETPATHNSFLTGSCKEQPSSKEWIGPAHANIKKIKVMKIDTLVSEYDISQVDIIKIDTEGGEPKILEGAKKTLDEFSPLIYAEVHYNHDLHKIVAGQGYKIKKHVISVTGCTNPIIILEKGD